MFSPRSTRAEPLSASRPARKNNWRPLSVINNPAGSCHSISRCSTGYPGSASCGRWYSGLFLCSEARPADPGKSKAMKSFEVHPLTAERWRDLKRYSARAEPVPGAGACTGNCAARNSRLGKARVTGWRRIRLLPGSGSGPAGLPGRYPGWLGGSGASSSLPGVEQLPHPGATR